MLWLLGVPLLVSVCVLPTLWSLGFSPLTSWLQESPTCEVGWGIFVPVLVCSEVVAFWVCQHLSSRGGHGCGYIWVFTLYPVWSWGDMSL